MFPRSISPISIAFIGFIVLLGGQFGFAAFPDAAEKDLFVESEARSERAQDIQPLKPGDWVEKKIDPNTIHLYKVELKAGDAMDVEFGENDIALRASIWGPEHTKFAAPDSEHPTTATDLYYATVSSAGYSKERLIAVAERTGTYHVRIQADSPGIYKFRYVQRSATDVDRKYAEAARLMFEVRTAGLRLRTQESIRGHYDRQIEIYRQLGDMVRVGLVLRYKGSLEASLGAFTNTIVTMTKSRDLFAQMGLFKDAVAAAPCGTFEAVGDFQAAIDCFQTNLNLGRRFGDKQMEARGLLQLGVIYHRLADEEKARHYYDEALAVIQKLSPRTTDSWYTEIILFTNFGNLARGMNGGEVPIEFFPARTREDLEKALPYLFKAVEICERINHGFIQFNYRQIGNTYAELGRYDEAISYFERSIKITSEWKDQRVVAIARKELARVFILQGKQQKGAELLEDILPSLKASPSETQDIASWLHKADRTERAKELLAESLNLTRQHQMLPMQARILHTLASIERDVGNFDNARKHILDAMNIADSLRNRITSDEIRSVYFSAVKKYYDFYIDLLMQAHKSQPEKQYDRTALEISESARSRNLMDLLKMSGVDIRQGVNSELLAREKALRSQLAEKATRENRVLLARPTPEEAEKAQREVTEATEELARVEAEIRQKSPRYASVTQPSTITVGQIQKLLDPGTVLLEYSLGEQKSYLWVVSQEAVYSFELPSRDDIDKKARAVYNAISALNENTFVQAGNQRRIIKRSREAEFSSVSATLAQTLLAPAVQHIRNKRLLVVPDGSLNYVPFAALPLPSGSSVAETTTALVQSNEIVTLPSASTLDRLRHERADRTRAQKMLAVFADPVFSRADARAAVEKRLEGQVAVTTASANSGLRDLDLAAQSVGHSNGDRLPRLPFSRREADGIVNPLPRNMAAKQVGFLATKDAVFDLGLDQYRIVHFATHGLIDSKHPALSGMVLSLINKEGGDIDGFLRLQDIYNLKLNADLVVLSACNTALGKEVRGEGLIGLTRGFMYAGTPRVVASLWKVDDAATAALMTIFYRKMIAENMRPAAALRAAQIEMMNQPRWRSPYYWAPFVLQGEWK